MDKETIIKGCENWANNHKGENLLLTYSSVVELLAVLKEQEVKIHGADSGMCEICSFYERAMPVKPQKATNPEESEYCCGICGYPLWLDELYCAHCGRRIEWGGR